MSNFYHFYSFRMSNSEQKHSFWMSVSWKVPFIHCLRPLFLSSTHIPPIHHRQCCGRTYISTQSSSYYDEGSPYQYDVKGKTASLLSEIIYENRLKPFTLSVGLAYTYKHTMNNYQGDVFALNKTDNNKVYAFGEIKGALKQLRYSLGVGISYIHYAQAEHQYNYCTFRPKVSIAYNIMK